MIRMPRRSVTRFFIPMIDVLTLLFCMFLLMPIIRENETFSQDSPGVAPGEELKKEIEKQQRELQEMYTDQQRALAVLAELAEKKRGLLSQIVLIRLLYVSPKDGSLYYFDPANLKRPALSIDNADVALALIARHKKEAGDRELLYIFQEPRGDSGEVAPFPTWSQENRYKEWFGSVNFDGCVKPPPSKGAK
jgi:hypothetical protein